MDSKQLAEMNQDLKEESLRLDRMYYLHCDKIIETYISNNMDCLIWYCKRCKKPLDIDFQD